MIGFVLAAGEGVRMRPLSLERPKPLMPTLDLPQLAWSLGSLWLAGVRSVWVNAHFSAELIFERARLAADRLGMEVKTSHEVEEPMGTAGGLRRVIDRLEETFVAVNSDVASDAPLDRLIEAHRSSGGLATLLAVPTDDRADLILEEGWVLDLIDRRERLRSGHRYGGIAVFEPEVLDYVPEGRSGLYETVFSGMLRDRRGIAAFEWEGYWRDVGSPSAHLRANLDALSGAFPDRGIPAAAGEAPSRRDTRAFVGRGAEVDGVTLRHTVVGSGARIPPGSHLELCVVWEGVAVERGDYRNAVITDTGVVHVE